MFFFSNTGLEIHHWCAAGESRNIFFITETDVRYTEMWCRTSAEFSNTFLACSIWLPSSFFLCCLCLSMSVHRYHLPHSYALICLVLSLLQYNKWFACMACSMFFFSSSCLSHVDKYPLCLEGCFHIILILFKVSVKRSFFGYVARLGLRPQVKGLEP